jgi:hyperosmotically inducible protein
MNKFKISSLLTAVMASVALSACAATDTRRSTGQTVDDTSITARVKAELIGNDTTKARQIEVETYRGVVQLNGFVDSQTERDTATRLARSVDGVSEVRNNLQIKESIASDGSRTAGDTVDDVALTAKVKAALVGNSTTAARRINVTTYSGVVQLSGFVNSDEEKRQAAKVAQDIEGVRQVRNEIEVKPAP